jgi:hypothetical protein
LRIPLSNVEREGEEDADAGRRNRDNEGRRGTISRSRVVIATGPIYTPTAMVVPAAIIVPGAIIVIAAWRWP